MYMNLKPNKHKISFNITTMTSLGFIIVGTPPPPPPPLLKGGRTFRELSHLRGFKIFHYKGGINL